MIAIVSSNPAERAAFGAVCDSRGWPHIGCDSVRAFRAVLRQARPKAVLVRNRLADGYSDDVLAALNSPLFAATRTIVLIAAGTPSAHEARQVALGADCVSRDPVRADVITEYLLRYRTATAAVRRPKSASALRIAFQFAGATIDPADRTIRHEGTSAALTPREVALAELLAERPGDVITYQSLYAELLGRRFAGDTSNLRVLLGKLDRSLRPIGINVRRWIEVIPKTGYRYHLQGIPSNAVRG